MTEKTAPPAPVRNASIALAVSGASAIVASLILFGQKAWVRSSRHDALQKIIDDKSKSAKDVADAKKNITADQLTHYVNQQVKATLIGSIITVLLCAFLAYSVYKGRHWSRWGVIGVWVLSTLTGSFASFFTLLGFLTGSGVPAAFRIPVVLAGVAFLAAIVFVCLRPSVEYFALSKPERGAARPARSGLFGPRLRGPQAPAGRPSGSSATPRNTAPKTPAAQKADLTKTPAATRPVARTKQRTEAVAKGADLARSRAKAASKSRRSGS